MKPMFYSFTATDKPQPMEVGAKAKALIELTYAKFPVPEGIVCTVAFFSPWLKAIKASQEWMKAKESLTKENCDQLKKRAQALAYTSEQQTALEEVLESVKEYEFFAVRSSSPEEDQSGNSFAGMYDTLLGVRKADLPNTIRLVFASLFDLRVMAYKRQSGMELEDASMAVIVQAQLDSEISGIGFSLNPKNNAYDEAVINAGFGLGEAIVSGIVTSDTYVVDKIEHRILEKKVTPKEQGIWLNANGGVEKRRCENPESLCLSDDEIIAVAKLIGSCEAHYGYPVDIEWAMEKERLYLLQVRPITTYIPLFPELMTAPGERKKLYVDAIVVAQGFAEPLSVLGLDLWVRVMDLIGAGFMPAGEGGYFVNLHGRQYFQVSNMLKGMGNRLGLLTVSNHARVLKEQRDELVATYKAVKTTREMRQARKAMVKTGFDTIPIMLRGMGKPQAQEAFYNSLLDDFIEQTKQLSKEYFHQSVESGLKNLEPVMRYSPIYSVGALALSRIKRMFKGEAFGGDLAGLQMLVPSNPTIAMGERQHALASLQEMKETATVEAFSDRYRNREYSAGFLEQVETYLTRFGYRGFKEIDVATSRVKNHPEMLFKQLKEIRTEDNQLKRAEARKADAVQRLRAEAAQRGKQKKFDRQLEIYERLFGFREAPKDMVAFLMGKLHELAMATGEEFFQAGRLDAADEIFDLHLQQIEMAQEDQAIDLRAWREENLVPYRKVAHVKRWPTNIDSRGKIRYPAQTAEMGAWKGEAISAGNVRGRAKVLHSPYEKTIEAGEILVTVATEPAWTPIFINAAGVVMEIGGILQHGAIIAREYGIPCVSGILDATQLIHDGDLIEIDGTRGIVRRIEE